MKEFMSEEARRYYEGGKRVVIDGIPCRVAAWARRTPGKALIKAAVEAQSPINVGDEGYAPFETGLGRFRFEPANHPRAMDAKPSKRRGYAAPVRFKSRWGWKPENLAYHPYECRQLHGTDWELQKAQRAYHEGDAEPLRKYLAATADERRAYWAAYDAAQAAETAASYRLAA